VKKRGQGYGHGVGFIGSLKGQRRREEEGQSLLDLLFLRPPVTGHDLLNLSGGEGEEGKGAATGLQKERSPQMGQHEGAVRVLSDEDIFENNPMGSGSLH